MPEVELIVGLGNPGARYERTRHNVGAAFVRRLAVRLGVSLAADSRFKGEIGRASIDGRDFRLLIPSTFMNLSGESVGAVARFYKIDPKAMLVAYDEMAFEPGVARIKSGGGANGHNGIRSIISACGNRQDFHRLRIGVGHPGSPDRVTAYLTGVSMPASEAELVDNALHFSDALLGNIVKGEWQSAMNQLHAPPSDN